MQSGFQSAHPVAVDDLDARAEALAEVLPDAMNLRLHRALSWLKRAEQERDDEDVRFILLWISFNAAYAREVDSESEPELACLRAYFASLVQLDLGKRIRDAVIERFRTGVHQLVDNRYLFAPFWKHYGGEEGYEDWATGFSKQRREVGFYLDSGATVRVLMTLFGRLYMLRNQLLHGAATWRGRINREQVTCGTSVLGWLTPIFLDIMLANPTHDWGEPRYPPVERPDS